MSKTMNIREATAARRYLLGLRNGGRDLEFDPQWYLNTYPDARAAIAEQSFADALQHYLQVGAGSEYDPNSFFSEAGFLRHHSDNGQGRFSCGFARYLSLHEAETRKRQKRDNSKTPRAAPTDPGEACRRFDPVFYAKKYPEARAAVAAGQFSDVFQYYLGQGISLKHNPNQYFDETFYRTFHPDITASVEDGVFVGGFHHYLLHGSDEGRETSEGRAKYLVDLTELSGSSTHSRSRFGVIIAMIGLLVRFIPDARFRILMESSIASKFDGWESPRCKRVIIDDDFASPLSELNTWAPDVVVAVLEPSRFMTERSRGIAIVSEVLKSDIEKIDQTPGILKRFEDYFRVFVPSYKVPGLIANASDKVVALGLPKPPDAGNLNGDRDGFDVVPLDLDPGLDANGRELLISWATAARASTAPQTNGIFGVGRDGWVANYAAFRWEPSERARHLRLAVSLPITSTLPEVELKFVDKLTKAVIAVESVRRGEARILRVDLSQDGGAIRMNATQVQKIIGNENLRTFRSVNLAEASIQFSNEPTLFQRRAVASASFWGDHDTLLARITAPFENELLEVQSQFDTAFAELREKFPAYSLLECPRMESTKLGKPSILLVSGIFSDEADAPEKISNIEHNSHIHYLESRGFSIDVVKESETPHELYDKIFDRKLETYVACVVMVKIDPRILIHLKERFPSMKLLYRPQGSGVLDALEKITRQRARGKIGRMTALFKLMGATRLALMEWRCAKAADAVIVGNDWDRHYYWSMLRGKAGGVFSAPPFRSQRFHDPIDVDGSLVRKEKLCLCLLEGTGDWRETAQLAEFRKFSETAKRCVPEWRFQVVGDEAALESSMPNPGSIASETQEDISIRKLETVSDPGQALLAASTVAILSNPGASIGSLVVRALENECALIVAPDVFHRIPVEARQHAIVVTPDDDASVARAFGQVTSYRGGENVNRQLMRRFFAQYDDVFGFS